MIILATESASLPLGLRPKAELRGWALNSDGFHISTPNPRTIARCFARSLENGKVHPEHVDYYNAHGTSTRVGDQVETTVIKDVFVLKPLEICP